ncbi:hypothetical protein FC093_22710 [Ilyomonas limi]|uniref:AAA+ ATPase domain-containing protein n=1 Tax=Ilyomonas limi TaxID=2575867 RepID=A0A4U3KQ54_9BACT|nr:hypothetical protein [Ilyomonas limi]TKK64368.1 hypothetical protein FC093_22710 [Ilyomonas limi]
MGKVSTAKQTGQGGVYYEDKVVAYFLACMLSETLPFGQPFGLILAVGLQVRPDGWLFDDVLLTLQNSSQSRHIAVSIKSNRQFNSNGCPKDINQLLWEQYLHYNTDVFGKDLDKLCLIEAPISPAISTDLNTLLQQATYLDSSTLHRRISIANAYSKSARKLYKSFYCPSQLANIYKIKAEDTGNILQCFLHLEMDVERIASRDEARCIELCKNALRDKSQAQAEKLYDALCLLPRKVAPKGGSLDRKKLLQILSTDFSLNHRLAHELDWKKITDNTIDRLSFIPDKLGNQVTFDRSTLLTQLEQKLLGNKGLIIQGISGSGKTNLAKMFAEKKLKETSVIWLDSSDFDFETIETSLRLTNSITELIEEVSGIESYLFVDGIERLFHAHQLTKLATILKKALIESSSWKVIFTCPSDQLSKVEDFVTRFNLFSTNFESLDIPELTVEELIPIAISFPELHPILFANSSGRIFNNLKLLDKLIRNIKSISFISSTNNLGESHLIDFVWSEEIESKSEGLQLSYFLKRLAELQADDLSVGVSIHAFPVTELKPADNLKLLGFLRLQHEKLYFNHDLFGDWARYKLIKSHNGNLPDFLQGKDFTSPLWARAVRLYGIHLLEQEQSGTLWQKTFNLFSNNSPQHLLVQDLLLESFFFAPNSYSLLVLHKTILYENECTLLKRITNLFLLRATKPDANVISMAKEIGMTEKHASAYYRIPITEYWFGMLKFLSEESVTALEYNLVNVVKISSIWLDKTPTNFSLRKEASDLSLQAAEKIFSLQENRTFIDEKILEPVYKAFLLGYRENPDGVAALCLRISRRVTNKTKLENEVDHSKSKPASSWPPRPKKRLPWPLGPMDRVDDTFRTLCLEGPSLFPIFKHNPRLGTEILLAALIEEPRERWHGESRITEHYELIEEYRWYPPFYLRGPYLNFLKISPVEGINFICKLVDFATERW